MKFETILIHGGVDGDEYTGAVNVPVYLTSTYKQDGLGGHKGYEYSRTGNPTRFALEKLIAEMEGGKAGFAFASGMAAITAVLTMFGEGDKILISSNIYGGTYRVLDKVFRNFGLQYEIVDTNDESEVLEKLSSNVKAIFIETPTNPLMSITDIAKIAALAKKREVLTIVDNTFMTPYLQKPIELGADIVVHSATKYLGGHSDLLAGLVVVNTDSLAEEVHFIQNATGGVLAPFDSWLLLRGIKTLSVRMDRHVENAIFIAESMNKHAAIEKVYFAGLESHSGYEIHSKQSKKPGAVISLILRKAYDINTFLKALKIITVGESLGGVESLMTHPATMTHGAIPYELRQKMGITGNLVRLSVGLENKEDLLEDILRAIETAHIL